MLSELWVGTSTFLGVVLIASFVGKGTDFEGTRAGLSDLIGLSKIGAGVVAVALLVIEAGFGLYLALFTPSKLITSLAIGLFLIFTLTNLHLLLAKKEVGCLCFGHSNDPSPRRHLQATVRSGSLLLISLVLTLTYRPGIETGVALRLLIWNRSFGNWLLAPVASGGHRLEIPKTFSNFYIHKACFLETPAAFSNPDR